MAQVRLGHPRDSERVARHLAGRAVGLVLGGGGARGLAHLGVLRAMEDLNIPVDFIGGTSQVLRPPPPLSPGTKWTRRVPHPVLIGHAASLTPYPSCMTVRPATSPQQRRCCG